MHKLIVISILILLSACNNKLIPTVDRQVNDSVHVSDVTTYIDTAVSVPADSVSLVGKVENNSMPEILVKSNRASLKVRVDSGTVKADCDCGPIELQLKNKTRELSTHRCIKTVEVIRVPPVIIEKTPTLTLWLSWIGIGAIILFIIYLVIKLYLPKLPI